MKVVKVEGALVSGKTGTMSCPGPVIFVGEILAGASQQRLVVGCSAGPGPVLVLGCSHHTVPLCPGLASHNNRARKVGCGFSISAFS